ncbi:MAT1-1-2 [Trichoderma chlorosporum]
MENICSFEPMWKDFEADVPQEDITRIRLKALEVFLLENKFLDTKESPSLDYIMAASLEIMNHLLCFWKGDNPIIARIRTVAVQRSSEPIIAVQGAIALWYTSCMPIFERDIHQGVSSEEEITTFEDGTIIATWNREYAAECHYAGNLGLMAMLLTTEVWLPPKNSKLQIASLISCATTTMLFAAYMISSRMPSYSSWSVALSTCPNNEGLRMFLRSAWRLSQKSVDRWGALPGGDFGAHIDEMRISCDGKTLLSKVGRADWARAPFWHPCKKIPGSHWNKWIKNLCRPIFPTSPCDKMQNICIIFRLPSSAALLTAGFGEYYSALRTRFDQKSRSRSRLTPEECKKQFRDLAMQTGCEYPYFIPAPEVSSTNIRLRWLILTKLPDGYFCESSRSGVKKPICDSAGNLTFPFLNTAVRALRFEEDPDEIEQNLFMMTFPLTISLPL